MNRIKIGKILIMVGIAFWIIENFYFGWNKLPMSEVEKDADTVSKILFYVGFFIYSLPIWSLYENAVKNNT